MNSDERARQYLIRRDSRFERESYMPEALDELMALLTDWEREARLDEARQSPHEGTCTTLRRSGKPCDCGRGKRIAELEKK